MIHFMVIAAWLSVAEWRAKQETHPKEVEAEARASMKTHVAAMVDFWNDGVPTLDYGNNIRQVASEEGLERLISRVFCSSLYPTAVLPGNWAFSLVRPVR